tara:strand:- start:180 stop:1070 length:891 start_codon:yes stop_codon:yes gene_type:complete
MTVFLGNSGRVRLRRSTPERTLISIVDPGDINVSKKRFSFDFPQEMLITGDRLQIKSTNGAILAFIDGAGWDSGSQLPDGAWYINVDELGGICLYDTFANALNGQSTGKITLNSITTSIPIEVKSVQAEYNILGLVRSFELNNDREVVDITALGDEFRKNESSLISGSGSISCEFHYDPDAAGLTVDTDVPSYLHELILRQKLGAEFDAELYIVEKGENAEATNDFFYFEFKGIVTNAAIGLGTGELTVSNFNFVTTGAITPKLGLGIITNYVLKEDTDRILLQQPGSGKLELETD